MNYTFPFKPSEGPGPGLFYAAPVWTNAHKYEYAWKNYYSRKYSIFLVWPWLKPDTKLTFNHPPTQTFQAFPDILES
jgi:hypothetical protein